MSPLALVLWSALFHATWNLLIKRHPDPNAGMTAVAGISGLFGLAFTVAELARGGAAPFPDRWALALAIFCGLSESVYFLSLGRALRDASLGLSYVVVRGGGVLLVWPLAYAVHHEVPTPLQAGAVTLMLCGLALLVPPGAAARSRAGYGWAMLAALCVGINHVAYKAALNAGGRPWAVFGIAMLVATPATVFGMGEALAAGLSGSQLARTAGAWRRAPWLLISAGVLSGVSFGLSLHAMQTAGAAWVGTLRNTSVALAPLLGWGFLGERPGPRARVGFVAVAVAVVLLAR